MIVLASKILRLRSLFAVIASGIFVSLATGLVETWRPDFSIMEYKYYGYPLVWRVTALSGPTEFRLTSLLVDATFWIAISFLSFVILKKISLESEIFFTFQDLFLPLVLFLPMGFAMDFVHEFGHAIWGVSLGGRFSYMQIAYFEIYPRLGITPQFCLGQVVVMGLAEFESGLFLLGGSLTTNVVSWFLVLALLKTKLGHSTQIALKMSGLFGLLDLPFYVFFPQIGLRHWVFLGGDKPEPLLGARKIGVPDPLFYIVTVLVTFGLTSLYLKASWEKVWNRLMRAHTHNGN